MADHAASAPMPVAAHPRHLHLVQRGQPVRKAMGRWQIACLAPFYIVAFMLGGVIAGPLIGLQRGIEDVVRYWRQA